MAGKRYFEMRNTLLYPKSTLGPPWLDLEKVVQSIGYQTAQKCYFEIGFFKYSTS